MYTRSFSYPYISFFPNVIQLTYHYLTESHRPAGDCSSSPHGLNSAHTHRLCQNCSRQIRGASHKHSNLHGTYKGYGIFYTHYGVDDIKECQLASNYSYFIQGLPFFSFFSCRGYFKNLKAHIHRELQCQLYINQFTCKVKLKSC